MLAQAGKVRKRSPRGRIQPPATLNALPDVNERGRTWDRDSEFADLESKYRGVGTW